jgi:hypothetical protein
MVFNSNANERPWYLRQLEVKFPLPKSQYNPWALHEEFIEPVRPSSGEDGCSIALQNVGYPTTLLLIVTT